VDTQPTVQNIMTTSLVTVAADTPLTEAAEKLSRGSFSGLPVTSPDGKLLGIFTEYDLLTKGATIHLPTFIKLLKEFPINKKDKSIVSDELKKILSLTVKDVMNDDPFTLHETASLEEVALAFAEHHRVNPIPIVDSAYHLVGVVSRYDIIKFYSPFSGSSALFVKNERNLDKKMNAFLNAFEKRFILVSQFRSRYWFFISFLFVVVGFALALFLLGRIVVNY
jgi:CBS domain-containing protein